MTHEPKVEQPYIKVAAKNTFRILIIDSEANSDKLKNACKQAGHAVVAAKTINEAMLFLNDRDHADVVVCAAFLEDQSMFDFLTRLRKHPIHREAKIMILALASGPIGVKMCHIVEIAGFQFGADAFVNMPEFDASQLIAEIEKLLPEVPMLEKSRQGISNR